MNPQTQIIITHKNDLPAYLGDWKAQMGKSKRCHITRIPKPIESFSFNSDDFSILLRYLDNRLGILEETIYCNTKTRPVFTYTVRHIYHAFARLRVYRA
jgi:hypothetical protein